MKHKLFGILVLLSSTGVGQAADVCTETCPDGWVYFHGSCYLFIDEMSLSWPSAAHICSAYRANLVGIETKAENNFIKSWLSTYYTCSDSISFWLGATDIAVEGDWTWHGDDSRLNFTDWATGHPRAKIADHDCAVITRRPHHIRYSWMDLSCTSIYHSICERK